MTHRFPNPSLALPNLQPSDLVLHEDGNSSLIAVRSSPKQPFFVLLVLGSVIMRELDMSKLSFEKWFKYPALRPSPSAISEHMYFASSVTAVWYSLSLSQKPGSTGEMIGSLTPGSLAYV
jgi:hypothetical protein